MNRTRLWIGALAWIALGTPLAQASDDGATIFKQKCTICHQIDKKRIGPAVKHMSSDPAMLRQVITHGRNAMPAFGKRLSAEQIEALISFIRQTQQ